MNSEGIGSEWASFYHWLNGRISADLITGSSKTIENLPSSANLRSLFLGKNKITKIQGLEGLTGLKTLSIQSKFILIMTPSSFC